MLGSKRILRGRDLPPVDERLGAEKLGRDLKQKWGYSRKPSRLEKSVD